jgi:3-methylcrotonyl-CoA carboxylase alpha subunit
MATAGVPLGARLPRRADQNPALLQREADSMTPFDQGQRRWRWQGHARSTLGICGRAGCQREARNSFGDDAVLIEKYVQRPRH